MGATAGAFAAAATTPLDVIKTNMMCTAASRPTMMSSARAVMAQGGPVHFFRCIKSPSLRSERPELCTTRRPNGYMILMLFHLCAAELSRKKSAEKVFAVITQG